MDEFVVAQRDPDVRGALTDGFKEDEVTGLNLIARNGAARLELCLHLPWQLMADLRKDKANEAAAVES